MCEGHVRARECAYGRGKAPLGFNFGFARPFLKTRGCGFQTRLLFLLSKDVFSAKEYLKQGRVETTPRCAIPGLVAQLVDGARAQRGARGLGGDLGS